jgi:hypothetical protein
LRPLANSIDYHNKANALLSEDSANNVQPEIIEEEYEHSPTVTFK